MDENKQIDGMARLMCKYYADDPNCCRCPDCWVRDEAKVLYEAGYRKQSEGEWIKYPHGSGIYCSLCKHKRRYRDIHDAFCPNCGAKMKGE